MSQKHVNPEPAPPSTPETPKHVLSFDPGQCPGCRAYKAALTGLNPETAVKSPQSPVPNFNYSIRVRPCPDPEHHTLTIEIDDVRITRAALYTSARELIRLVAAAAIPEEG